YERAVVALLERDGPAVLMGHSMGGAVSIRVAAHRPELVRALVLLDPALPSTTASLRGRIHTIREFLPLLVPALGRLVVSRRHRRQGPDGIVAEHIAWNAHRPERIDPELRADLVDLAHQRWKHQPEVDSVYAASARSVTRYVIRGMRNDLEAVHGATLLIHAEHDRLIPLGDARVVAERHPEWDYQEVPDCGHAVQIELPDRLLDITVPWIARHLEAVPAAPRPPSM
ncbi:MAG: alpha/beta fold hydrolase, partial [Acidimicrobiia bacterium]